MNYIVEISTSPFERRKTSYENRRTQHKQTIYDEVVRWTIASQCYASGWKQGLGP